MGLRDRIGRLLRRAEPETKTTIEETPLPPAMPGDLVARLTAERERAAIVTKCNEMYENDPRCEQAVNTLARDIVKGGYVVRVKRGDARAQDSAAAMYDRLDIASTLDDWVRETLVDGDSLLEVGVNEDLDIAKVTRKPTLEMHRNSDRADEFAEPARAFWYAEQPLLGLEPPSNAIWFAQWQIVHARWNHRSKSKYGRPLFASATGPWKRVQEGELDIAVRRKTRAGMKFLHVVEGADDGGIREYRERNKDALTNPFAMVADFFTNKPGSISAIQGDARLADIGDVVHQIETWWTASPTPLPLIGYGKDLNRDILKEKLEQYKNALEQLTQWCEDELVKPLLKLQWLLNGIVPEGLKYEIEWKSKAPTSAADIRDVADAAVRLKAVNVPDAVILAVVNRFLPWLDIETLAGDGAGDDTDAVRRMGALA